MKSFKAGNSLSQKLKHAVIGSVGVRIAGMVITFLVGVQLARYLGPEGYGIYGTVMALVAVMAVPAQLGLPQLITREISTFTETGNYARVKGALIWFAMIICVASVTVMFLGYIGFQLWVGDILPKYSRTYWWGLLIIPLIALLNYGSSGLRGFHHVVSAQIYDALMRPALFAIFLFLGVNIFNDLDASTAMAFQVFASVFTLILCTLHLSKIIPKNVYLEKPEKHSAIWRKSAVTMTFTEVFRVLNGHYGVLLLGIMATIDQVGIFRVALAVAGFVGLPSTLINVVVMPYVAQLNTTNDSMRLQKLVTSSAIAMFSSTLVILLVIIIFGEFLLTLIFGEEFVSAWWVLTIVAIAYVINSIFGSVAIVLTMCGHEAIVAKTFLAGLLIGGITTILFFDVFGIAAASIAMVVSELLKGLIMWWKCKHYLSLDTSIFNFPVLFIK